MGTKLNGTSLNDSMHEIILFEYAAASLSFTTKRYANSASERMSDLQVDIGLWQYGLATQHYYPCLLNGDLPISQLNPRFLILEWAYGIEKTGISPNSYINVA